MTRKQALSHIRMAGYHADHREFLRLYTENRISIQVARNAWSDGQRALYAGVRCDCVDCKSRAETVAS